MDHESKRAVSARRLAEGQVPSGSSFNPRMIPFANHVAAPNQNVGNGRISPKLGEGGIGEAWRRDRYARQLRSRY
jgi:hypothetical protein